MTTATRTSLLHLTTAAALVLGASACASTAPEPAADGDGPQVDQAEQAALQADRITVTDPWVKAAGADDGMTAAFGVLGNEGAEDAVLVAARADDVSELLELHEVVSGDDGNMLMREKEDGFTVPAGSEHELSPGADHIMFMGLEQDLEPGAEVTVTLEFDDGSTHEFTAPVKDFEGANESYHGDH